MATGSGKTLITHINYHQFFHYRLFSPDNIILITPNEGLSKQHFEELQKSDIPCKLYEGSLSTHGPFRQRGFKLDDLYKKIFAGKGRFSIYELKNAV